MSETTPAADKPVENPNLIVLKVPVKIHLKGPSGKEDEQLITSLEFRDVLTGADYVAIEGAGGKLSLLAELAARLTGQPRKVIDRLDANSGDFTRVMQRSADFLKPIQEIAAFL